MRPEDALRGRNLLIEIPLNRLLEFIREHCISLDGGSFPDAAADLILMGAGTRRMFQRHSLSQMIDCPESAIRVWEKQGLPSVRIQGGRKLFYLDEVQQWLSGDFEGVQRLVTARGGEWSPPDLDS